MRWVISLFIMLSSLYTSSWGFHAHKDINYYACFTLPVEMFSFYKQHISLIREWAIRPDQRRYVVENEGMKHYLDLDFYELNVPLDTIPRLYDSAVARFSEEKVHQHGIAPWNIMWMKHKLTAAFEESDALQIVKLSADLGHYVADVHVPLHTTTNYNGQFTNQKGIHGLWESRLPELFAENYNFGLSNAVYLDNPQSAIWQTIEASYAAKDSVLLLEKKVTENTVPKYSFENRGKSVRKVYSSTFSQAYHQALNKMVERRMQRAIQMVGNFWYTCWVDAGQPILEVNVNKKVEDNISSLDSFTKYHIDSSNQRKHLH